MVRPKISAEKKREVPIPVRFSREEIERIKKKAQDRMGVSTWVRNAALDKLNGKD